MNTILFLLPYILIPCLLTFIWHRFRLPFKGASILITALLISAYPFLVLRLDDYYNSAAPGGGGKCGMAAFSLIFTNFLLLLPASLVFHFILNFIFLFLPDKRKQLARVILPKKG